MLEILFNNFVIPLFHAVQPRRIFKNQEFGDIHTISNEQGEPMFFAKDVCDALEYNNSRDALRKHIEEDDVAKRNTILRLQVASVSLLFLGMK